MRVPELHPDVASSGIALECDAWCDAQRQRQKKTTDWVLRAGAIAIAAYGVYAFTRRQIGEYLFLRTHFLFLDPREPIVFFFLDYLAIMGLFVFIGHYLAGWLKRLDKKGGSK